MPTLKKHLNGSSVAWFLVLLVVIGGAAFYSYILTIRLDAQHERYRLLEEQNKILTDHIASLEKLVEGNVIHTGTRDGLKQASYESMNASKSGVYKNGSSRPITSEANGPERARNPIVIQVGSTTAAEVMQLLGKPTRVGRYDSGSSSKTIWCTYYIYGKIGIYFDGSGETAKVREIKGDIDAYISNRFGS